MKLIRNEPIAFIGIIQAILLLVMTFGVNVTDAQQGAIIGVLTAFSVVVGRSKVSPVDKG
jgi:hypothetical protein